MAAQRRNRRSDGPLFERDVSTACGKKCRGTPFRRGALSGDAYVFQHKLPDDGPDEGAADGVVHLAAALTSYASAKLKYAFDLVRLRVVAGWTFAAIAEAEHLKPHQARAIVVNTLRRLQADPFAQKVFEAYALWTDAAAPSPHVAARTAS